MSTRVLGSMRRSQRVEPSEHDTSSGHIMVELRKSRCLRVLHLNPRPRDARFQQEMVLYLQYRKSGPAVMGGPITMPRRLAQPKQHQDKQSDTAGIPQPNHPLAVTSETKPQFEEINSTPGTSKVKSSPGNSKLQSNTTVATGYLDGEHTILEDLHGSGANSLLSSPTHTATAGNTRSASSVLVALHNQVHPSQTTGQLSQIPDSDNAELKLNLTSKQSSSVQTQQNSSPPVGPLSPETQTNDASTCPDLYTPRQNQPPASSVIISPKSTTTATSSSCPLEPPDTDLVMFFIHGVGGCSDIWRGQTEYFAHLGYEVVAPDLIGHGMSSAPKDSKAYHFQEIAADMEELFDTFCKRRNILIGHSYGASFVTLLARTRARRVTRLVLVSGGPPAPLAPQPGVFTLPACMLSCIKPCLTRGFYNGAFNSKPRSASLSAPRELAFQIPARVLQHTMNGQEWSDGDELYHNWLTCPTLLLYGDKDKLVSLHEEQEMLRAIYDSRLEVIHEASHMVMMEASSEVNSVILSFLLHPSPPPHATQTDNDMGGGKGGNTNNSVQESSRLPTRSKSRKSLRSAKTPRSRPERLLSKSVLM